MAVPNANRKTAPPQRADPQRSRSHPSSQAGVCYKGSSLARLQRTVGNRALSRLLSAPTIQPKLTISDPEDESEREAEQVADRVTSSTQRQVQRTCACDQGECTKRQKEKIGTEQVQTKRTNRTASRTMVAPTIVNEVLRSPGQPLDTATRHDMGARLGHDFRHVRVHTDERAASSSEAVNAKAYTVGSHIIFNSREFAPRSREGRRLLAHELVHVLQQGQTSEARSIFRKEDFAKAPANMSIDEGGEQELEMLLTQITDRTDQNLQLRQQIDTLPETSSNERDTLSNALAAGRTELIGLLQRRTILLNVAIESLRLAFQSGPKMSRVDDPPAAEQVFFKLSRYERQLKEHQDQLRPLLRLQMRQQIATIDEQVAELDKELALLPQMSDPKAPAAELLALKRAELIQQRKTLVKSMVSGAVEYKQFDKRWGAIRYGNDKKCTSIKEAGCGPASLAILLNYLYAEDPESLTGGLIEFVTPKETAVYAATHGRVCNSGTGETMVTQVATQWPGFRGKKIKLDTAITELRGGNLVIFLCKNCTGQKGGKKGGNKTYGGHFMVLSAVDEAGTTFNVLDPGAAESGDIDTIAKKELSTHAFGFWIIEKK
jgi:hypothetical protein